MKLTALLTPVKLTTFVVALSACLSFASAQVWAQQSLSLTAIPPRLGDDLSLKAKPGEKLQASIRVMNTSNEPVQVQSLVQDFIVEDGETPLPVTDEVSSRWSLAKWVTLTPSAHTLQPKEIGTLNVLIEIPSDALPGGHYAMVTHQPSTTKANAGAIVSTGAGSSLNQRVGTLLYVVVDGPINEEAFIRNLTMPKFSEFGPVPFSFSVDNQSDIHISPQIGVEIYNIFGRKVETVPVEAKNIFPLMSRDFSGKWNRIWGIGPYQAKVVMSYGTQGQVVMATTSFWLFPLSLVLAGLVVLMVFLVVSISIRRHLDHRNDVNRQKVEMLEQRLADIERQRINDLERK